MIFRSKNTLLQLFTEINKVVVVIFSTQTSQEFRNSRILC